MQGDSWDVKHRHKGENEWESFQTRRDIETKNDEGPPPKKTLKRSDSLHIPGLGKDAESNKIKADLLGELGALPCFALKTGQICVVWFEFVGVAGFRRIFVWLFGFIQDGTGRASMISSSVSDMRFPMNRLISEGVHTDDCVYIKYQYVYIYICTVYIHMETCSGWFRS